MDTASPTKLKHFKQSHVWQNAHRLVLQIYVLTKIFPKDEQFCLSSQLRRAAISITSNIAEGFSRNSEKERVHFYHHALGSLSEAESQLEIVKDLGYANDKELEQILNHDIEIIRKQLLTLLKVIKRSIKDNEGLN